MDDDMDKERPGDATAETDSLAAIALLREIRDIQQESLSIQQELLDINRNARRNVKRVIAMGLIVVCVGLICVLIVAGSAIYRILGS